MLNSFVHLKGTFQTFGFLLLFLFLRAGLTAPRIVLSGWRDRFATEKSL